MKKLAELITERSSNQAKLGDLANRIKRDSVHLSIDDPNPTVLENIKTYCSVLKRNEHIINLINTTNHTTKLPNGMTIAEALCHRDYISKQIGFMKDVSDYCIARMQMGSNSLLQNQFDDPVRFVSSVDTDKMQQDLDASYTEFRALDSMIQLTNWQTEVNDQ